MATLSPQFFELLEARQTDVFFRNFDTQESLKDQVFFTQSSTKAYEDRMRVAGLGTFATKPEGTPISYDDPAQGTRVRTVHQTFGLGWRATEEMLDDDQHSVMNQMSSELGLSAADHRERLAWGLVNDGFTGTTYTGLEGQALFSAAHTLIKGNATVNASNILSPAVALSETGLESMMNAWSVAQSDEGRYIRVQPRVLVVPPALQQLARKLLITEYKVGSSDNDRSVVVSSNSGMKELCVPYLSSTTNWFVFSAPNKDSLVWNDRKPVTYAMNQDSETFDKKFSARYRASVMHSEWRRSYASQA